jgi:hypothetical protein
VLSYTESFKLMWAVLWRSALWSGGIAFPIGFYGGFTHTDTSVAQALAYPIAAIFWSPLVLRKVVTLRYAGFHFNLVRDGRTEERSQSIAPSA